MKYLKKEHIFNKLHKLFYKSDSLTLENIVNFLETEKTKSEITFQHPEYLSKKDNSEEITKKAKYNLDKLQIIGFIHKQLYLDKSHNYSITPEGINAYKFVQACN